jgi:hypothetical protein
VKLRLMGLANECSAVLAVLREHLEVIEVASPYPNRGDSRQVRLYVETRTPTPTRTEGTSR